MTKLLDEAFEKAAALPANEQDALADRILEFIEILEDEARWDAAFARSQDQLGRMADEALEEFKAGRTTLLEFPRRK
jgi:hypothetical protein